MMQISLYFSVLFCIVIYQLETVSCYEKRILNGVRAKLGMFASHVQIRLSRGNLHQCAGVLIEEKNVVTAASCVRGRKPSQLKVMGGDVTLHGDLVAQKRIVGVESYVIHPFYNPRIDAYSFNVAVIHLEDEMVSNKYLLPVPMLEKEVNKDVRCFLPGWGARNIRNEAPHPTHVLYYAELYMVELMNCGHCPDASICAVNTKMTEGGCQGDEGGGLYCDGKLRGIYSGSFNECSGGAQTFGDILELRKWIIDSSEWEGDGPIVLPSAQSRKLHHKKSSSEWQFPSIVMILVSMLMLLMVYANSSRYAL